MKLPSVDRARLPILASRGNRITIFLGAIMFSAGALAAAVRW
jgi:hypothetical protein